MDAAYSVISLFVLVAQLEEYPFPKGIVGGSSPLGDIMITAKQSREIAVKVKNSAIDSLYGQIANQIEQAAKEGLISVTFSGNALGDSFAREEVIKKLTDKQYRCEYIPPAQMDPDHILKIYW